jgi:hypothetical protein
MSNLTALQVSTEDEGQRLANIELALKNQEVPQVIGKSSATITPGVEQVFITWKGVTTLTLANPVSGTPGPGVTGQDGFTLCITDTTGYAHTLTTGTNGINGAKHVATFAGAAGSSIYLKAFGGSWWMQTATGVTLT